MAEVRYTRNLFLRGMCIIYLFAFLSFYVQIPGLYGDNGVLPARSQVDLKAKGTLLQKINQKPTLLWLAPFAGLNVEYMMDLIALFGSILSFLGFISQKVCIAPVFASLWALYFSLFQVGQVFVQNNWDTLLLEAGFLCILIAPVYLTKKGRNSSPSDALTFWTVRWLLFRYMFSCSISKLASKCSSWWTLDALSHYFENQCLPAPLGWYAHHLPTWFLRFNTVLVFVFEIVITLLFFFPLRKVRITAYYIQMFLQVHIITTGNWNFRDFLVICGLIALLDDQFFYKKKSKNDKRSLISEALSSFICVSVYTTIVLATIRLFKIKLADNWTLTSEFVFTQEQFDEILPGFLKMVVIVGLVSMAVAIADSITYSILTPKTVVSKITTTITTAFYIVAVMWLFVMSTVPLSSLHQSQNMTVPLECRRMYNKIEPLHIVNGPKQFALFPKMTGLNGRPEIIIEGSNDIEGPWKEFEFLYKPGNVNNSLPFVAPHTPRLDWQMWWAAQGTYHQNPWIMSLAYRILTGQKEVTALLNDVEKPFGGKPPKYVRATLYHYHFAPWRKGSTQSWWTRERIGEYFPIYSRDHTPLLEYLTKIKVLQPTKEVPITNDILKSVLAALRTIVNKIEPSLLLWSIFTAGCAIIITGHSGSSSTQKKK